MTPSDEPAQKPPASQGPGGILGTLLSLTEAVRSWRQLVVLVVLGAALLIGLMLYERRERLGDVLDHVLLGPPAVSMVVDEEAQAVVTRLASQLEPVAVVVIWRVDLPRNRRVVVALEAAPAVKTALPDMRVGQITSLIARIPGAGWMMGAVLDGEVVCGPPPNFLETVTGEPMASLVPIACIAGVPLTPDALVGMVGAGFSEKLSPQREEQVVQTLRAAAEKLTVRE
jgi:hypothetical protein